MPVVLIVPIGHEHSLELLEYHGDRFAIAKVYHRRPDGVECVPHTCALAGRAWANEFASAGVPIICWSVLELEPLTLSPSILCRDPRCKDHGYLEQGKWRPV